MPLKIGELAELSGVTVRTLQHYDRIGLLTPEKDPTNGYRFYVDGDIDRLQEILLMKALGFPLKEITKILDATGYQRLEALKRHREVTLERIKELNTLKSNIERSILEMEEGAVMDKKEKFEGMDFRHNPYEEEARKKWGDARVDESNARMAEKSDDELTTMEEKMSSIIQAFADLRKEDPTSPEAEKLAGEFHGFLNQEVGNFYTLEVFKGLGEGYLTDERFTRNLDKYGEGTAKFMRDAMVNFADRNIRLKKD